MRRLLSSVIKNHSDIVSDIIDIEYPKSIENKIERNRDPKLSRLRNNALEYVNEKDICLDGPLWNEKS